MKKFLAILLLGFSSVYAQTVTAESTTPNLITSGTTHTWTGVTTGSLPANYMPGGPTPIYDPNTNTVSFSYNANAYVGQTIAINQALANVGAGVKINGYNFSYDIRNMNGDDRQPGIDTITIAQALRGANNSVLLSSNQYYNTKFDWKTVSGSTTAATPIEMASATYLQFGMTGGDNGYWGGYFGPQVRNVNMSLRYTVDPCAANPAYSPTCANYNTVNISNNLVPNPGGYAVYGSSIDNSYAINQALALSGANVMIHGFQWGYQANANGPYCTSWDIFGCWGQTITPSVTTNVNITDNNGASLYNVSRTYTYSYNTTNYQYLFPSSRNLSTLGRFNFTATTNDAAYIGDMWSRALYTPDPCADPLSSPTCPGYAQAYFTQQCTISALYNSACPGYAEAVFMQQCNANQLSNPSCPGYASAYLLQQCSINPLYSTTCSGYDVAQTECSSNPLSHTYCTNYQSAANQCSSNPIYAPYCPGYQTASLECGINPLSHSYCPTYQRSVDSCTANSLSYSFCPGYTAAQTTCSTNPLSNNLCANYATASTQCSINPLYANYCPGYSTALNTCSTDPLSNNLCSGYQTASSDCGMNQLSHAYCPSYQSTLNTCSTNPLSNSLCPGYQTASQSCSTNSLYASYCSGYQSALDTCSVNPLSNTMCPSYQTATSSCAANPLYANYCPGYNFAYACQQDGLYSKQCPNYSEAYAKKFVLNISPSTTTTVVAASSSTPTAPTTTTTAPTTESITTQLSSGISDSTVSSTVSSKATTANAEAAPASAVKLTANSAPAASPAAPQQMAQNEPKKESGGEKKEEKKDEGSKQNGPSNQPSGPSDSNKSSDQPKSNREALAERRREAAQKEAVAKGKDLANEMGKAADMEAQKAVQNVVIQAMGFTPGFDTYNKAMLPDARFYAPKVVYGGQVNVDNKAVSRRLMGGSDRTHQEMVESQYNRGND